ncbi:formate dehydrogenase subunit gamma [Methylocystis sp. MJC1]|jgi:formate dehydrogenase subunit gamma|uniref:Formate dehydrogenase subunit gamma n=1 Tax=Methylocystis iwaonis TaxID=2885079 RepID=A0ABN6VDY4_9HYPH|nr:MULTISPECIES: formate dehydrogenase subunit gamma [Methylocystis]KAF2991347.1 NADP-reducing hydrogenase subunit HndA [Methylocystis sp. MJC1]MBL1257445.1 formate dehydrogenase subunit gamma [Methylocystis sp. Sn-Cys]MBU6526114.1 formate dehydrogenase subunit gamma [Methylocystis sp. MJC1]MDJ0449025.1 formate dehydrogenase subunit gamma [Methylocystis sp. JR02]UZX12569.1 formate dehydrogenase subunit gamma [Methylocystis sp. MJC1]
MAGAAQYSDERAREIIAAHMGLEGPALPILHALQAEFGYVPDSAVKEMATALNISRAEMHGVVTFYHDFHSAPHGRHTLKICRAESCQSMGAEKQANDFLARQKLEWHQTTPDGSLTVEPVYCLGLCAHSPAALYDGEPIGQVDAATLDEIVAEAKGE